MVSLRAGALHIMAALAALVLLVTTASDAKSIDPAARGLDVFLHAPASAAPGSVLPIQIEAIGFSTVVKGAPLSDAVVEAVWDLDTLRNLSMAPPSVLARTDATGEAHLDVPVPDGDEADLVLLVAVRSGTHARTRQLHVKRSRLLDVQLQVTDPRVVPGGVVSAWAIVRSASTAQPIADTPVQLALLEGGVARFEVRLVTDSAGSVTARVPIPRAEDPAWRWTLEARAIVAGPYHPALATLTLTPREETPGTPRLRARFASASVHPGDQVGFSLLVRDATDLPVADVPVRFWIGPRGTTAPVKEQEWLAASTRALTDAAGEVTGNTIAPTVVKRGGTSVSIVARAHVDGRDLESTSEVEVGVGNATAKLLPEAKSIVPGVEQHLLLRVLDGFGAPIAAEFAVEGDGLAETLRTDANGEGDVTWKVPADIGARRNVGPCAGDVAASVRVRATADVPQLLPRRDPFDLCLSIDRGAAGIVRANRTAARIGDTIHVTVTPAAPSRERKDATPVRGPWSVVLQSTNEGAATSAWIDDGEKGGDLVIPRGDAGVWHISAVAPATSRSARVLSTALLVTPKRIPKLSATLAGGRLAPGGAVDVDMALTDDRGAPMTGSIAAVMIDARGGGSTSGIEALDTRRQLCAPFPVDGARCDKLVEGDRSLDVERRGDLASIVASPLAPAIDPGADASELLRRSFSDVMHSLEGAVFEASTNADSLRDVRRRGDHGWQFNPELMTLVTSAMPEPPLTPGGEPLALGDLIAVDPQVTFDVVARRITRLKLFRILTEVRAFKHERSLDDGEPLLANPNALIRRLVRDARLTEDMLVDPWGGTIQFTKSAGAPIPFLSAIRGFELRSPGPDGKIGDGDDVRDPFERVLKSKTPYATAMDEDRIVDAKSEMEVGEETVGRWSQMFAELTGTELGGGRGQGIGLGSLGSIGHGSGSGVGYGMGSGRGRMVNMIENGVAFWSPPQRTDVAGKLRVHVPLGDAETTWRLAVVGLPDDDTPATTTLDLPVSLQLSARVDAGARWVEGDVGSVPITIRNRAAHAVTATITMSAGGVVSIAEPRPGEKRDEPFHVALEIPAEGAAIAHVRLKASAAGEARLDVRASAPGATDDVSSNRWEVRAAGEATDFTSSRWVDDEADLALTMPTRSFRVSGAPRLVIERGWEQALAGALESLDPDYGASPRAMADAIEAANRIGRWAMTRGGEKDPLVERARAVARHATGRLAAYMAIDADRAKVPATRAMAFAPTTERDLLGAAADCPLDVDGLDDRLEMVDAEPATLGGAARACWDAFVSNAVDATEHFGTAEDLAHLFLAVADKPQRLFLAETLADRLRERVAMKPSGSITLGDDLVGNRSARATIFAALLRASRLGKTNKRAGAERLLAWIAAQRDADGGYGSPLATRSVVRALLAEGPTLKDTSRVTVIADGTARTIDVFTSAHVTVPLPANATKVTVKVKGPGVMARFERPVLRLWSSPPDTNASPLRLESTWPEDAKVGEAATLRVRIRNTMTRSLTADMTLPLPPGAALAAAVDGVRQIQGALVIRRSLAASDTPELLEIPLRFSVAGRFIVPEARARVAFEEMGRAIDPARPIVVK